MSSRYSLTPNLCSIGEANSVSSTIAPGEGAIVELTADTSVDDTEVCFENIVLADPSGVEIEAGSECSMFGDELDNDEVEIPQEFSISKIYPNPFNPSTTISYNVPSSMHVNLSIYDIRGRLVTELVNGHHEAQGISDPYKAIWNADMQASGVYFVRLTAGHTVENQKIMLIK